MAFASPLVILTLISLSTTWQNPRGLFGLLFFGLAVGGPILWWGLGHRVELTADRLRHHMPLAPLREVLLSDVELVDLRPADRRWPFRSYVVTLATMQGLYLPFETANFAPADLMEFLGVLMDRAPRAAWTARAEDLIRQEL